MDLRKESWEVMVNKPVAHTQGELLDKVLACWLEKDPGCLIFSQEGYHWICLEVLTESEKRIPSYLVLIKLSERMRLGRREKGLLDGLRFAFAAACIQLGTNSIS
jgi:hypothetical protein